MISIAVIAITVVTVFYWCPGLYFLFVMFLCGTSLAASIIVTYFCNRSFDPTSSAMSSWVSMPLLPRDTMLARYMLPSCVCRSVHLSVRLSIASRYCNKTTKRRIIQTTPYGISQNCSFLAPKTSRKFQWGHPQQGR